jgi:adenosine deaminase
VSSDFQIGLEAGDIGALRRVPKADLHNHFIMGGDRAFLRARTGRDIAPLERPLASMADMHAWVDAATGGVFDGAAGRLIAFEAALVRALADGVTRLEIGEDVWAITLNGGSAGALTDNLQALHRRVAPNIEWIALLGVSRHCAIAAIERWMEPFLGLGVYRALDLSGDEFAQPIEAFVPVYRRAKAAGLRLKAHVGEWGSADDVWRAVELLELDEVQHGLAAAVAPQVMRFLADHRIRLNLCPTSNLMLGRVESLATHPIRRLFDAGVRVTVNTDDALMFGQNVSDEFLNLYRAGVFSAAELDQIRLNGLSD